MFEVKEERTKEVYKCKKCGMEFQKKPVNGMCMLCAALMQEGVEID